MKWNADVEINNALQYRIYTQEKEIKIKQRFHILKSPLIKNFHGLAKTAFISKFISTHLNGKMNGIMANH